MSGHRQMNSEHIKILKEFIRKTVRGFPYEIKEGHYGGLMVYIRKPDTIEYGRITRHFPGISFQVDIDETMLIKITWRTWPAGPKDYLRSVNMGDRNSFKKVRQILRAALMKAQPDQYPNILSSEEISH